MLILFVIATCIIIFGVFTYDKWSYKAAYYKNKENDIGYYWGGKPRNQKTIEVNKNKKRKINLKLVDLFFILLYNNHVDKKIGDF